MFNSEQRAHMSYLATVPPEQKCWCGWNMKGECHACPPNLSTADRLPLRCKSCGNSPSRPGAKVVHIINCTQPQDSAND